MKSSSHLSLDERSKISVLQSSGESIRSIARILGRSPSTISRELNRTQADKFRGNYIASTTHARVQEQWKNTRKRNNSLLKQRNVREFIEKYLQYGYSPAIISHLIEKYFCEKISHETLYIHLFLPEGIKKVFAKKKTRQKIKEK